MAGVIFRSTEATGGHRLEWHQRTAPARAVDAADEVAAAAVEAAEAAAEAFALAAAVAAARTA